MARSISICIVCDSDEKNLRTCMSGFEDLRDEVIIVGADVHDKTLDPARDLGVKVYRASENDDLHEAATAAIEKAQGEWILMLKPGEVISAEDRQRIRELCKEKEAHAYYFITRINLNGNDLGEYEWVGNRGKYSHRNINRKGCVQGLEIRLFRKSAFKTLISLDRHSLCPHLTGQNNAALSNIHLTALEPDRDSSTDVSKEDQWQEDYQKFINENDLKIEVRDDLEVLGSDYLGYSMLREEDLPALTDGLEMGFGNVDLLKWMVQAFIKKGSYDKAIDFADTIIAKLGDHIELWRLKGSAYFYQLNLEEAEKCYKKALSLDNNDANNLFNLAKVYIISQRFPEAKRILQILRDRDTDLPPQEIEFISSSLEKKQGETANLSLLMLCRDEEDYIARALESVKDVVDEIVIVDTGSEDKSKSIAKEFGAKVVEHPWREHFSEARNAGLERTSGDYVLSMDADEFISRDHQIALLVMKKILPLRKRKAIVFQVQTFQEQPDSLNPLPPETIVKRTAIFPRLPGICFSGRVFESVDDSLKALNITRIIAENLHFLHISENTEQRKKRKSGAFEKWATDSMNPEDVFKGVLYWMDLGNFQKAWEWFGQALSGPVKGKYDIIIDYLVNFFEQNGYLNINSPTFKTLLTKHKNSYPIMSLCAHILYRAGSYRDSTALFAKLLFDGGNSGPYRPHKKTRLKDLAYFATVSLEGTDFEKCDMALEELANEESMKDTFHALLFYYEVRKRDIEKAISVLDSWIIARKLPVKVTLNNFVDLLNVINEVSTFMTKYGQIDATNILSRSAHHLVKAITITSKE
ncbi:glycosyltransferase [Thermodesulfobacteriota bacterium]